MSYTALYRKFRPMKFSEMVGQEAIIKTLKNQIKSGRVGHAYLFNGVRGTGKTSAAKIMARAINCKNPIDGEPCNECEICKGAISGALTDIVEMDAASNNSVEDIRAIRDEVNFLPTKAKYRVYIIDEVHMLSTGAFNALLKTLEEPPEHVKFILATTEPQKLPATILSRCQRFDFKRLSNENINQKLAEICKEINVEISESALNIISVLSEGAMRDALSILERCIQDGETYIDEDKIKELVGIPKIAYVQQIIESIINKDVDSALEIMNNVLNEGKDLSNFIWEIIKYTRDILITKVSGKLEIYNKDEKETLENLAAKISKEKAIKLIHELSELDNELKISVQKTIIFQAGIIRFCSLEEKSQTITGKENIITNTTNSSLDTELDKRVTKIENYLRSANVTKQVVRTTGTEAKPTMPKIEAYVPKGKTQEYWPNIIDDLKKNGKIVLYTNLLNTVAREENEKTIAIEFPKGLTSFGKTILEKSENKHELETLISGACGKTINVKYIDTKPQENESEADTIQNFANKFDIPFNIEN